MPKKLQCPSCGANLEVSGKATIVRCEYCDAQVQIFEEAPAQPTPTPQTPQVIISTMTPDQSRRARRSISCIIGVVLLIIIVTAVIPPLIFGGVLWGTQSMVDELIDDVPGLDGIDSSFATPILTFGSQGTGPGQFDDARYVATDPQGNIYVGEYDNGRIQVFDPAGTFITAWTLDNETPLQGFAVDRSGTAYVSHGGVIYRYDTATGQLNGQLEYAEGWGFGDLALTLDGGLLAAWEKFEDVLVRFDQGAVTATIPQPISSQTDDHVGGFQVAVDGLGNIYLLSTIAEAVFAYTPDGTFIDRFGGEGTGPGQFTIALDIAVDGQGRVYVSDAIEIEVFGSDGQHIDTINVGDPAYGLFISDAGNLFVAAGDKVIQYDLPD